MSAVPAVAPRMVAVRFLLEAEVASGLLPRLLQPFAKRDLTPDRMWSQRVGETLQVEIALNAVRADILHLIEGNLRQVIGVCGLTRFQPDDLHDASA